MVSEELMVDEIYKAREVAETYGNSDFIINGRTDILKTIEDREDALNMAVERSKSLL